MRSDDDLHQNASESIHVDHVCSLAWLVTVTFTAAYQKLFSPDPRIGFLAQADGLAAALAAGQMAAGRVAETQTLIFNARMDAAVCGLFLILVTTILIDSVRIWVSILRGHTRSSDYGNSVRTVASAAGGIMKQFTELFRLILELLRELETRTPIRGIWLFMIANTLERSGSAFKKPSSGEIPASQVLLTLNCRDRAVIGPIEAGPGSTPRLQQPARASGSRD